MPQDSTYFINPSGDTVYPGVTDSITAQVTINSHLPLQTDTDQTWNALYLILIITAIVLVPSWWNYLLKERRAKKVKKIYEERQHVYDTILNRYMPYYRHLPGDYKKRFLKRTLAFMTSKNFRFVEIEEEERMALLISATAIQLTFGLKQYLMDHFEIIYVMRTTYRYGLYNIPFEGHVNANGIYLSWENFLNAYTDYGDGDNVGLHEMAHALTYVNFTANRGSDDGFKMRFRIFSKTGRAIFGRMLAGETFFLGNYAATNYEEFWAVCVENFFERPKLFNEQLPGLYEAMCNLLNQDMLAPDILQKTINYA